LRQCTIDLDLSIAFKSSKQIYGFLPLVLGHVQQVNPGDEVYARVDDFRIGTFAEFSCRSRRPRLPSSQSG
jgi:hypothetical protein